MKATTGTAPYVDLYTTDEFILFPEDNNGTIPLDPNNQQQLRSFSPFVLSVTPPSIGRYSTNVGTNRPFRNPMGITDSQRYSINTKQARLISPNISTRASTPISRGGVEPSVPYLQAGVVDRDVVIDAVLQHQQLRQLPPIVFLINPISFAVNYTDIQNYGDQSKYGFIFYRWGEDLTKISVTCKLGAFIAGRENPNEGLTSDGKMRGVSGLQFVSRKDSAGWRQLMAILGVYRNSVTIADRLNRSRAYHDIGTQSIHYDGQRYVGRMDSFSFGINEENQLGGVEFSFEFVVYEHYQEGFEMKTSLSPMYPPSASGFGGAL